MPALAFGLLGKFDKVEKRTKAEFITLLAEVILVFD
jgi:hypothetical protein